MQGNILHEIERVAANQQTLIIKINIDEYPHLTKQLQVQSLPTWIMVNQGRIVERQSGVANKSQLLRWIDQ